MSKSLDSALTKRAYSKEKMSDQQLLEFAQCADPQTGPYYFINNFFNIQHPKRGRILYKPFEYQDELIRCYHENRFSINLLGRQMGKALALDTPVITLSGFSTVGELSVGDRIYGPDGKPTTVTFITETMNDRPCYEIEFAHGETIVADAEHLWNIVLPKTNQEITVTTLELLEHHNRLKITNQSLHIRHTKLLEFDAKPVPVDPYYLGLWIGDGGLRDIRITCTCEDYTEYQEIFQNRGLEVSHFKLDPRSDKTGTFYVKGGTGGLKEIGVWGNKHIPRDYIFNDTETRLELLRGLMDSDGTCEKTGVCRFYQSNEKIIDEVRLLLSTLGIKTTKGCSPTTHKDSYTLCFAEKDLSVFNLSRKAERQQRLKNHPKNKRIYIKNMTPTESVPVRCLQVNNDSHLFLCGNTLIPTHNTTTAAGYLLWYAMFIPDSTILIAAHKFSGAQEIMQRVRYAYELCPDHIRAGVTSYNKGSIEFDNGSRIISQTTTETTGRGMAISLLYCDEFAFVRPSIAKEFWTSISPTLATGGSAIITSTPNSDEDQFWFLWKGANKKIDEYGNPTKLGVNGFASYIATWDRHPERDANWAADEIGRIGEERFKREHLCTPIIYDETLINSMTLLEMQATDPIQKQGQVRWWKKPERGKIYVVALDPSLGTGGDNAAIQVYELPSMIQVAEWTHNKTSIQQQVRILAEITRYIAENIVDQNNVYYSIENNTLGEAALVTIAEIGEENISGIFLSEPYRTGNIRRFRKGFNTTNKSKLTACSKLKNLIETGRLTVNSKNLISELKYFVADGSSYSAKPGEKDDLVMSTILAIRMSMTLQNYDPAIQKQLQDSLDDVVEPMPFIALF